MTPLTWNEIADDFPGIHCPEVAIKRTAERCKKLGLIKCNNRELTDYEVNALRREAKRAREDQRGYESPLFKKLAGKESA